MYLSPLTPLNPSARVAAAFSCDGYLYLPTGFKAARDHGRRSPGQPVAVQRPTLTIFHVSQLSTSPWEREEGSPSTSPSRMGPPHVATLEVTGSECELPDARVDFCSSFCRVSGPNTPSPFPGGYLPAHCERPDPQGAFSRPVIECKSVPRCVSPLSQAHAVVGSPWVQVKHRLQQAEVTAVSLGSLGGGRQQAEPPPHPFCVTLSTSLFSASPCVPFAFSLAAALPAHGPFPRGAEDPAQRN